MLRSGVELAVPARRKSTAAIATIEESQEGGGREKNGKKMVAMVGAAAIASLVTALPADGITFCLATSLAHRVRKL
jgi:hypothetical protein